MSSKQEDVFLSPLKLAKPSANSQPPAATNRTPTQSDPNQNKTTFNPTPLAFGRSKLYETLSTETMTEDLAPDAGIWQQYLEEAREHDEELVKGQNGNLDMMLLFAALFSAILSAFLIESKNMLQQDPADVSIALLLSIAQSQQRIEHGAPQLGSAPIELPSFTAALSARWINGLWFFALALSLSAALIAMLAKEWLTAFTASRPRTAHAYTILHQARLIGLTDWHALNIIDLLPSMLHLALLLFSLGLVIYLWTLDSGIASVVAGVAGVTMVFYAATAFAAAIYESCPFVTQISKYIHRGLGRYAKNWMNQGEPGLKRPDEHTTDEEQRALIWLMDNSRDIDVVDYAYMCLTGLRLQISTSIPGSTGEEGEGSRPSSAPGGLGEAFNWIMRIVPGGNSPKIPDSQDAPLRDLFNRLCEHFSHTLVRQPRELAACQGLTIARYACALPQMVECLQLGYNNQTAGTDTNNEYGKTITDYPAITSFAALDAIWSDQCPALSPNCYALLTSAELQLAVAVASPHLDPVSSQCTALDKARTEPLSLARASFQEDSSPTESFVEITLDSVKSAMPKPPVSLLDLRARYSRTLTRVALLMRYHADGRAPIDESTLIHLIESVRGAALCRQLNPESHLSTHQPQSASGSLPLFHATVIGMGSHSMYPYEVGDSDGPLVVLLRLLDPSEGPTPPALERVVARALGAIAPLLLKQWLKLTLPHGARKESEHGELSETFLADWPLVEDSDSVGGVKAVLTRQVMRIAIFAVSHAECHGIDWLPQEAMQALYRRCRTAPGDFAQAFKYYSSTSLGDLICSANFNSGKLGGDVLKSLIDIFLLKHDNRTLFQFPGIAAASIAPFLRILDQVPCEASERQTLLDALANFTPINLYSSQGLTGSEDGFGELLKIGERDEYRSIVAKCISRIIETAASRPRYVTIEAPAVLGACDAVAFALGALASDEEGRANLLASTHMLLTFRRSSSLREITTSPAATNLWRSLQSMNEQFEQQEQVPTVLEEMLSWWGYWLPAEGLGLFFDHSEKVEDES